MFLCQITVFVFLKARPKLSKNVEQIEALLKRINEENKKTKEVLDNITKNELNGNRRKNSDASNESDSDLLGK